MQIKILPTKLKEDMFPSSRNILHSIYVDIQCEKKKVSRKRIFSLPRVYILHVFYDLLHPARLKWDILNLESLIHLGCDLLAVHLNVTSSVK